MAFSLASRLFSASKSTTATASTLYMWTLYFRVAMPPKITTNIVIFFGKYNNIFKTNWNLSLYHLKKFKIDLCDK